MGFLAPKAPSLPPAPAPAPPVPTQADASVGRARDEERRRQLARKGQNSTILTSPLGLSGGRSSGETSILGG